MSEPTSKQLFTAEWILPVCGPPVRNAFMIVEGDRIRRVGKIEGWDGEPLPPMVPGSVITPGLVNIHLHLEQSFEKPVPKGPDESFTDWLVAVRDQNNAAASHEERLARCRFGAEELLSCGTTCVNDIASGPESLEALNEAGLRGLVCLEFFNPGAEISDATNGFFERFKTLKASCEGPLLKLGLSPHSAYNVSPAAWETAFIECGKPSIHTHLAEFPAEVLYLKGEESEIQEMHQTIVGESFSPQATAETPVKYMKMWELLRPGLVAAHLIETTEEDREILENAFISVAHCPRSNLYLHGKTLSHADWEECGVPLGLGTDGRMSTENLDLREEARTAMRLHGWDADTALEVSTWNGAQALWLEHQIGTLEPGKQADFVIWQGSGPAEGSDLWIDPATQAREVYVAGQKRWAAP